MRRWTIRKRLSLATMMVIVVVVAVALSEYRRLVIVREADLIARATKVFALNANPGDVQRFRARLMAVSADGRWREVLFTSPDQAESLKVIVPIEPPSLRLTPRNVAITSRTYPPDASAPSGSLPTGTP